MNIVRREYADNEGANKDILGIADIGRPNRKAAKEANLVSMCMLIQKDTSARIMKSGEHCTQCLKMTRRTQILLVSNASGFLVTSVILKFTERHHRDNNPRTITILGGITTVKNARNVISLRWGMIK